MRSISLIAILLIAPAVSPLGAQSEDKATSLSDAQTAVEANLRTAEGKAFDQKFGADFFEKHLAELRSCKQTAGGDFRSFWILVKLDREGSAKEILLYPRTKLGACADAALLKDKFMPPPRAAYWVSVYLKIAH